MNNLFIRWKQNIPTKKHLLSCNKIDIIREIYNVLHKGVVSTFGVVNSTS